MMMNTKRWVTLALAVGVLGVALGMAGVSAWNRADTVVDKALMVAMACAVVLGVHLLPSLIKSRAVWPLWVALFAVAAHGHAGFFMHAGQSVSEAIAHARQAPQLQALVEQQTALQAALNGITARPVAVVAAQLARDPSPEKRAALQLELSAAQKAVTLRDSLVTVAEKRVEQASHAPASDPVTQGLALVTGLSLQAVTLLVSLVTAALLELLGVALWRAALLPEQVAAALPVVAQNPARDSTPEPVAYTPEPVETAPSASEAVNVEHPAMVKVTAPIPPEPLYPMPAPVPKFSPAPVPAPVNVPVPVQRDSLQVLREAVAMARSNPP